MENSPEVLTEPGRMYCPLPECVPSERSLAIDIWKCSLLCFGQEILVIVFKIYVFI